MRFIKEHFYSILLIFLLSFFTVVPFFHSGFFPMHDDTQVARVFEMSKSLSDGMFPVRWVSDLGYGYGYPIFNFYSPLPYYVGGFFVLLGLDALLATKITFLLGILGSGISMYFLSKSLFGKVAGILSALLYAYFPYHAINIYVRGDLDEVFSYAFLPLFFLGFFKLSDAIDKNESFKKTLPSIFLQSIALALIAISHNLTFFMLLLFAFLLFVVFLVKTKQRFTFVKYFSLVFVLAFLLSAFYTLPAVFEAKYTDVFSQVGKGANYLDHFVCPGQLWDSPWGFGGSAKGCIDGLSFKIGKFNTILLIGSFLIILFSYFVKKSNEKKFYSIIFFLLFFFSVFMTLEYSKFLWDSIPFAAFLQYPWRFLNFAGLFLSILVGLGFSVLQKHFPKLSIFILFLIMLRMIIFDAKPFVPQKYILVNDSDYTNSKYLTSSVSKISDEYMPQGFIKPNVINQTGRDVFEIVSGQGTISLITDKTTYKKAVILLSQDGFVRLNIAYFPSWQITADSKNATYAVEKNIYKIFLSKGRHELEVRFVETPLEKTANIFSFSGLIALFIGIISITKRTHYGKKAS